jgi:hypothetical protein
MKKNTQEYNWLTNPSGSGYRLSAAINGFLTLSMVAICIVVSYLPIAAEVAIAVTRALLPASMICGIIAFVHHGKQIKLQTENA